jgi:hypothetical protein
MKNLPPHKTAEDHLFSRMMMMRRRRMMIYDDDDTPIEVIMWFLMEWESLFNIQHSQFDN